MLYIWICKLSKSHKNNLFKSQKISIAKNPNCIILRTIIGIVIA